MWIKFEGVDWEHNEKLWLCMYIIKQVSRIAVPGHKIVKVMQYTANTATARNFANLE